jgi:hypothetical protein
MEIIEIIETGKIGEMSRREKLQATQGVIANPLFCL